MLKHTTALNTTGASVCVCVCLVTVCVRGKTGMSDIYKLWVPHPKDRGQPLHFFPGTFVSATLHHCIAPSATQDNTAKDREGKLTATRVENRKEQ